ncbi:MAG: hypothetical protein LBU58_11775 [Clostridiales bacterium]|jgi:hypothetical protein|nr:hypothetical protein [Clostridiales bacterium]
MAKMNQTEGERAKVSAAARAPEGESRSTKRQSGGFIAGVLVGAMIFGGSFALAADEFVAATPSTSKVLVDGKAIRVEAYSINDSNYFKLRDFASAVDVGVWYDEAEDTVHIETDKSYDPKYTGQPVTPATQPLTALTKALTIDVDNSHYFETGNSNCEQFSASVKVVEVVRGEAAATQIKKADSLNPSPPIGKEFILAWVRAKITDTKDDRILNFNDIRMNLHLYSSEGISLPPSNPAKLNPGIGPTSTAKTGDTLEGWVAFVVDKTDTAPRVQFGGDSAEGTGGGWFALFN